MQKFFHHDINRQYDRWIFYKITFFLNCYFIYSCIYIKVYAPHTFYSYVLWKRQREICLGKEVGRIWREFFGIKISAQSIFLSVLFFIGDVRFSILLATSGPPGLSSSSFPPVPFSRIVCIFPREQGLYIFFIFGPLFTSVSRYISICVRKEKHTITFRVVKRGRPLKFYNAVHFSLSIHSLFCAFDCHRSPRYIQNKMQIINFRFCVILIWDCIVLVCSVFFFWNEVKKELYNVVNEKNGVVKRNETSNLI